MAEDNKLVDAFDKNSVEEIRTQVSLFRGKKMVDIRIWAKTDEGKDPIPTKKGVTFNADLLPRLKESMAKAEEMLKTLID